MKRLFHAAMAAIFMVVARAAQVVARWALDWAKHHNGRAS